MRIERNKPHLYPQRYRHAPKQNETPRHVQPPASPPTDRIPHALRPPHQQKTRQRNIHRHQHRKHIRQPSAGIRPHPVRRPEFHKHPYARHNQKIQPASRHRAARRNRQPQRHKHKRRHRSRSLHRKRPRPHQINHKRHKYACAQQESPRRAESSRQSLRHPARCKHQHHQQQNRKRRHRRRKCAPLIPLPSRIQRRPQAQPRPNPQHRPNIQLPHPRIRSSLVNHPSRIIIPKHHANSNRSPATKLLHLPLLCVLCALCGLCVISSSVFSTQNSKSATIFPRPPCFPPNPPASPTSTGSAASPASSCSKLTATTPGSAPTSTIPLCTSGHNSAAHSPLPSSSSSPAFRWRLLPNVSAKRELRATQSRNKPSSAAPKSSPSEFFSASRNTPSVTNGCRGPILFASTSSTYSASP